MIVKITLHDNDFSDVLLSFCNAIKNGTIIPHSVDDNTYRHFFKDVYPHLKDTLADCPAPVIDSIMSNITSCWKERVHRTSSYSEDTKSFLINNFEVTPVAAITDSDDNGESFYVAFSSYPPAVLSY